MREKWDTSKHIAYFQARTNTYAPVHILKRYYEDALSCPGVVGLAIATRPDCLPDDVCKLLAEFSKRTYLTVELGLQTIHDETGRKMNRCHTYRDFLDGYQKLRSHGILAGVHLINGLPNETPDMMRATAQAISKLDLHFVKLHMLYVLKNTPIAALLKDQKFQMLSKDLYIQIICDQLELFPTSFVIGRLTGDGAFNELLAPYWIQKKLCVLNEIDKELVRRNTYQGLYFNSK